VRLWSLHPLHLDRVGLVAWWREALLAQAVLDGRTTGYRHHPQLERFRACSDPVEVIGAYLTVLAEEAGGRGYQFDVQKILRPSPSPSFLAAQSDGVTTAQLPTALTVTFGQLDYEWQHLGRKLAARSPGDAERWRRTEPSPHPLFIVRSGDVEPWERVSV
jgi:hypothetical protein